MNNTIAVIYNTCGLSGLDNSQHYIKVLNQLLSQDFNEYKVILSDCCGQDQVRHKMESEFGQDISYNYVEDVVPVLVSFNSSVLETIKHHGYFEGYLYVESGMDLENQKDILTNLYWCMNAGPHSIISAQVDTDGGYKEHGINLNNTNGFVKIPVGMACNGHMQMFSNDLVKFYGKAWADCFGSYCNESVLTYLAAAIHTNWVICTKNIIHHHEVLDGRSLGFNPVQWAQAGRSLYDHPFVIPSVIDRLCTKENYQYGLGYEAVHNIMPPKLDQFDENGFCINDKLKEICKEKLFLQEHEFNYNNINHRYIK